MAFTTMVIATPKYIPTLLKDFCSADGQIKKKEFNTLEDLQQLDEEIIFNCTGLGAKDLFSDSALQPVKGQLLLHEKRDIDYAISHGEFCLIPRQDYLVLGALFQLNYDDLLPNDQNTEKIYSTIASWKKQGVSDIDFSSLNLETTFIKECVTGLRPYRPNGVRLERELYKDKLIIHNYGHGGSGITFSWGCVEEAVSLITS